jgi:ferredoxin
MEKKSQNKSEQEIKMIPVFIMGKRYEVPAELTIMKAMEHAGYQFIRGCGCRGGICGACATVYRKAGDYKIYTGLACQTVAEPNMYLAQIPFYPANRATYDFETIEPTPESIFQLYPELFRCVACNACTKVCPMDVQVMDYIAELKRGDIVKAAKTSFDCIQCGLCASRCMGELAQYHMGQLARRLAGSKLTPKAEHMAEMVESINKGVFDSMLSELKTEREMEPEMGDEDWRPAEKTGLVS